MPARCGSRRGRSGTAARQRGSAAAEFTMVLVLLVPLFLGIFQVGLTIFVKNTLTACASEGARFGANFDRSVSDGVARARQCAGDSLNPAWVKGSSGGVASGGGGEQLVTVQLRSAVPALGMWGSPITLTVTGHAVEES